MSAPCRRAINARLGIGMNSVEITNQAHSKVGLTSFAGMVGSCEPSDGELSGESGLPKSKRVGLARFRTLRLS